jgi:hypothetical protein
MPYANARVSVKRHDQLPAWMLDCWNAGAAKMQKSDIENPEPQVPEAAVSQEQEFVQPVPLAVEG